jgi:NADH-quinone oxidoreductase subunit J
MTLALLVFYLLAAVAVAAGVMVISARNPVHSVLFLILAFFNAAGLFVLIGAEFLAMVLVVVYVGAVAVLFLFVVMMLDINFVRLREGFLQYLPVGGLIGLILLVELVLVLGSWALTPEQVLMAAEQPVPLTRTNIEALGDLFYTDYFYLFQAAGMILLVAIIGAITLTLRHKPEVRRQSIALQVHRRREEAVELRKVQPGSGI